jgi:hypothetical protein
MKTYGGAEEFLRHYLSSTRWRSVVSFTFWSLYFPGYELPRCPFDGRLNWPQDQSGRSEEEHISLAPTGDRTLAVQFVGRSYID